MAPENRVADFADRLSNLERDVRDHAKTITGLVDALNRQMALLQGMEAERQAMGVRREYLNERLDRIETSIANVYNLGKWVLAAFASSLIVGIVTFFINGGLHVAP